MIFAEKKCVRGKKINKKHICRRDTCCRDTAFDSPENLNREERSAFPLKMAGEGERVRIVSIRPGRGIHDKLAGIGLIVGEELRIIQNNMHGKILVAHNSARLFLGGGMAHYIYVVPVAQNTE